MKFRFCICKLRLGKGHCPVPRYPAGTVPGSEGGPKARGPPGRVSIVQGGRCPNGCHSCNPGVSARLMYFFLLAESSITFPRLMAERSLGHQKMQGSKVVRPLEFQLDRSCYNSSRSLGAGEVCIFGGKIVCMNAVTAKQVPQLMMEVDPTVCQLSS